MSLEPSMLQPALTLPFRLHGFAGKVTVRYGENRDPTRWGFDVLGLPFDIALAHGFPVCQADIAYDGSGYRAMMGWIQLLTVRDTHANAEDVSMDLLPIQTEADTPFCEFGQAPTFFDAPGPNPPRANEQWLASTFLAVCLDAARTRHVSALLGFRWGYDLCDARPTFLPLEPLTASGWNQHLPFLRESSPTWRFAQDFHPNLHDSV